MRRLTLAFTVLAGACGRAAAPSPEPSPEPATSLAALRSWRSVGPVGTGVQALVALPDGSALAIGARTEKSWLPLPDVKVFDPASNAWRPGPPLSVARNDLTAVVLRDGAVLVFGGSSAAREDVGIVERLDPGARAWRTVSPLPQPGRYIASVVLPSGKVFAASGRHGFECTGAAMIYDPEGDRWAELPAMPTPHTSATAVLDGKGRPVIVHGTCREDRRQHPLRFDPDTAAWTTGAETALTLGATASLGDGRTVVVGGMSTESPEPSTEAAILDATALTWQRIAPALTPRLTNTTAIRMDDGKVMVLGGVPAVDVYDVASNTWSSAPPLPTAQVDMHAVVLRSGKVLVLAGFDPYPAEVYRNDSWLY